MSASWGVRSFDYVVVGLGVAGKAAVETIRRYTRTASVAVVGAERWPTYFRPRLIGLVAGELDESSALTDPAGGWLRRARVEPFLGVRAVRLDGDRRRLALEDARELAYGSLVLAGGARPRTVPHPPQIADRVLTLRTLEDARRIIERLPGARRAVVVGGGFIGAELAEALRVRGLDVTLCGRESRWGWPFVDAVLAGRAERAFARYGVRFLAGQEVLRVEPHGPGVAAVTAGDRHPADFVVSAVGVDPEVEWLAGAGLAVHHGVLVDEAMRTSLPGVYAAGDLTEPRSTNGAARPRAYNLRTAEEQGRIAAQAALGLGTRAARPPQYGFRLFDLSLLFVGLADATRADGWLVLEDAPAAGYERVHLAGGRVDAAITCNSARAGVLRWAVERRATIEDLRGRFERDAEMVREDPLAWSPPVDPDDRLDGA